MEKKLLMSLAAVSVLGFSSAAEAAKNDKQNCAPEPGVCYSTDDCECYYCLGPTNIGVNPPVRPHTCNGDFVVTIAGFYWNANQDGMEYAIENNIKNPEANALTGTPIQDAIQEQNNLIDARYRTPSNSWDFGFKVGLGYNTTCDGWDIGVMWTWFRNSATDHVEAEIDDNRTLLPLWSAFAPLQGFNLYATDITTNWTLKLNLIDLELGREFWTSKYLTFRPFIGLRVAYIKQDFKINHKGGSWSARTVAPITPALNNYIDLDNNFHGVGVRGGFNTVWHLGCGWGFYGNLATSIVYGRFSVTHDEYNRQADGNHDKSKVLETKSSFRSSRAMLDLALGIQWNRMLCDCDYGFTLSLGWEHHMFFDQNQMWRVTRIGDQTSIPLQGVAQINNTGENTFHQRRGDLSTQGWTLTASFEF